MREIKFRVFNEITGKMAQVKTMCGQYVWDNAVDPVYDSAQRLIDTAYDIEDKSHLMQYTGLKDKNGKEIYEGDVVNNKKTGIWEVIFKNGAFKFKIIKGKNIAYSEVLRYFDDYEVAKVLEVIGNIYENADLLTAK